MSVLKTFYSGLKKHAINTTAMLSVANPIFGVFEKCVLGMQSDVFLNARMSGSLLSYSGMGFIYAKGRDISRKALKITQQEGKKLAIHDALYTMAFNGVIAPLIYWSSGAEARQIIYGAGLAMGISVPAGIAAGYAIDAGRDLMGVEGSARLPECVKKLTPKAKLGVAAACLAASIGILGGLYQIPPHKAPQPAPLEQRVQEFH